MNATQTGVGTHLWHLYLLDGADHVGGFFAPVTLDHVALNGRAVDRHDGVSCRLVGVEPARTQEQDCSNGTFVSNDAPNSMRFDLHTCVCVCVLNAVH